MRALRQSLLSVLILPLLGCTVEPTVVLPEGAVEFAAPSEYNTWWARTEGCAELSGEMARVEWYVVPDASTFDTDQGPKVGIRIKSGNNIAIVVAGNYQHHEMVVRHEMLHAILDKPGHDPVYFEQRCQLTWATWQGGSDTTVVAEDHAHAPLS